MENTTPAARWNIISKADNGLCYLDFVDIKPEDTGATIFSKLQQHSTFPMRPLNRIGSLLLYAPVVYTVTAMKGIGSVLQDDAEASSSVCEVFVKSKHYSATYTKAIRDPASLKEENTTSFLVNRMHLGRKVTSDQVFHGLLVVQELRHAKVIAGFAALAIISIGMGLVIGCASGQADIGIGVTASLLQLLTALQWSYIWAARR